MAPKAGEDGTTRNEIFLEVQRTAEVTQQKIVDSTLEVTQTVNDAANQNLEESGRLADEVIAHVTSETNKVIEAISSLKEDILAKFVEGFASLSSAVEGLAENTNTILDQNEEILRILEDCCGEKSTDTLILDIPITGKRVDGWGSPYEGGGIGGAASQGPRLSENTEVKEGKMFFHTRQYQGATKTLWNGYTVETGDFASAGIMYTGFDLLPGHAWEIECRALGPTKLTRHAFLTWPSNGGWPGKGEIDYWEAGGDSEFGPRQAYKISSWYKDASKKEKSEPISFMYEQKETQYTYIPSEEMVTRKFVGINEDDGRAHYEKKIVSDSLETHVYRVEWYEDRLVFKVDGNEVWYLEDNIPQGPHRLAFQTALEGGPKAKEGTTPAVVELSAARIYQMDKKVYGE